MAIKIRRTGHLVLRVKNLERSKRFFKMEHVSYELGYFAELQEAYRIFKENGVRIHRAVAQINNIVFLV